MTAAGHQVELRQSVFGWRAEFYREAMQHSRSTWAGVGTDPLPWRAVQLGGAGRTEAGEPGGGGRWLKATRVGRVASPHLIPYRYSMDHQPIGAAGEKLKRDTTSLGRP
jgi:hypothetical protein